VDVYALPPLVGLNLCVGTCWTVALDGFLDLDNRLRGCWFDWYDLWRRRRGELHSRVFVLGLRWWRCFVVLADATLEPIENILVDEHPASDHAAGSHLAFTAHVAPVGLLYRHHTIPAELAVVMVGQNTLPAENTLPACNTFPAIGICLVPIGVEVEFVR